MTTSQIIKEELEKVKINDNAYHFLNHITNIVIKKINKRIHRKKIDAKVFVGGSLAKGTLISKKKHDIDIFIRFNEKYSEEEINKFMRKIFFFFWIPRHRTKKRKIHGSRDYYQIILRAYPGITFEIVPSVAVKDPRNARNITDLSYFHVDYLKKEIEKNPKLADEIIIAKSFCHAQRCYGAESYIRGFSGYALELLMVHYKTFGRFLKEIVKNDSKIIIDPEKHYKTKTRILEEMNSSKLKSPVIIVDPTYKERNAAGALSYQTFNKFRNAAKAFLKEPSEKFFEYKSGRPSEIRNIARRLDCIYAVFEIHTRKQEGDIAGSKLLKFSKVLTRDLAKTYNMIDHHFEYESGKKARVFYALQKKRSIVHTGPSMHHKEAAKKFKEKHRIWYEEEGKLKAARSGDIPIKEFLRMFRKSNKKTMREMAIRKVKLI